MFWIMKFISHSAQGFVLKLKAHILPRIAAIHQEGVQGHPNATTDMDLLEDSLEDAHSRLSRLNHVVFHGNKIYRHRLLRINYTTYDLQRDFDNINPHTDKKNIMLLSNEDGNRDSHPFSYARVLGVFHTNIIFTGPGSKDFRSRRVDFLWVRWFELVPERTVVHGWEQNALDTVRFLPMADEDAFGFVDPADVLRGCHVIPSFVDGPLHPNGVAISRCAGDSEDWKRYYINR